MAAKYFKNLLIAIGLFLGTLLVMGIILFLPMWILSSTTSFLGSVIACSIMVLGILAIMTLVWTFTQDDDDYNWKSLAPRPDPSRKLNRKS